MTDELQIMVTAVVITALMMLAAAADPLSRFSERNPALVMLALAFR